MHQVLHSSIEMSWATPWDFFNLRNKEGRFTLDPAASPENAKCKKFFTKEDNGLVQSWAGHRVFLNPPYGRELPIWMKKVVYEVRKHHIYAEVLVPARSDTKWWYDSSTEATQIRLMYGRIRFLPPTRFLAVVEDSRKRFKSPAFPSALFIFDPSKKLKPHVPLIWNWNWKAELE